MLQRARCHMETKEWEAAVRIFERMNNRWKKVHMGLVI